MVARRKAMESPKVEAVAKDVEEKDPEEKVEHPQNRLLLRPVEKAQQLERRRLFAFDVGRRDI